MPRTGTTATRLLTLLAGVIVSVAVATPAAQEAARSAGLRATTTSSTRPSRVETRTPAERVALRTAARFADDQAAMESFRPGFAFWQHIFTIADGSIAYGSAVDGRLLAVFPASGDWSRSGSWDDPKLKPLLNGARLSGTLGDRRDEVAALLARTAGPVVHNPTRGLFVSPNARRYGRFLGEWAAIYERFGVPAELGLAQALVESGLNGKVQSESRAIGFCQWLTSNWNALKRRSPHVIEGHNQTTQAPYCAAYLSILATKYGTFIPALSEHHAGGTNVGRTIDNGQRLGGRGMREYYFLGAAFTRELRTIAPNTYGDVYGTYGPRSFYYAEMVFGNVPNVQRLMKTNAQVKVHAMRTTRTITLTEIMRRTKLSADEIRRFNPALIKSVPARATLYLPRHVPAYGRDVAFWHRPATAGYATVLSEFLAIDRTPEEWDTQEFAGILRGFERRFRNTKTEEGTVMATVLAYVIDEILTSGRGAILDEFRNSLQVRRLFEEAVLERNAARATGASASN
jgi:hypothetical protein